MPALGRSLRALGHWQHRLQVCFFLSFVAAFTLFQGHVPCALSQAHHLGDRTCPNEAPKFLHWAANGPIQVQATQHQPAFAQCSGHLCT